MAVANFLSIWPRTSLRETDCCWPPSAENASLLRLSLVVPPIFISRPSKRTRFKRPTKPLVNAAVPLPRPFERSPPFTCMPRPSRLVKTIVPVSASTEASTPVWSFTLLIAFTKAPLLSFAFTSRSPIFTPLIERLLISPPGIATDAVPLQVTSNVALTPVLFATLLMFSASAPIP